MGVAFSGMPQYLFLITHETQTNTPHAHPFDGCHVQCISPIVHDRQSGDAIHD